MPLGLLFYSKKVPAQHMTLWRETLGMLSMWAIILSLKQSEIAHGNSHGGETIQVLRMGKTFATAGNLKQTIQERSHTNVLNVVRHLLVQAV